MTVPQVITHSCQSVSIAAEHGGDCFRCRLNAYHYAIGTFQQVTAAQYLSTRQKQTRLGAVIKRHLEAALGTLVNREAHASAVLFCYCEALFYSNHFMAQNKK